MRVLVTGATGFIGRHVARMFAARGAEVTAVCRGRPETYDAPRRARIEAVARSAAVVFDRPFGAPAFLQLLDDLQDARADREAGHAGIPVRRREPFPEQLIGGDQRRSSCRRG